MIKIEENIWSYFDTENFQIKGGVKKKKTENFNLTSVSKVRLSKGHRIKTYRELVKNIAIIVQQNKRYDMFFRGQSFDYKDKNERTVIYPTICRPEKHPDNSYKKSIRTVTIQIRYEELINFSNYIRKNSFYISDYYEYYFALIKHYELIPTPFIDITQSIRTAASFALEKTDTGFLYVFGLPYAQGSISHFIDLNIVLVKLQSVCPPDAKRPHFQEGFLVGRLPFYPRKTGGDNLGRRLVAKFLLDNTNETFWDSDFTALPKNVLTPKDDEFEKIINHHYDNYKAQQPTTAQKT